MSAKSGVRLLAPGEVAERFNVSGQTVNRWAASKKLLSTRTLGNHRRFFEVEVDALLAGVDPAKARKLAEAEKALLTGTGRG